MENLNETAATVEQTETATESLSAPEGDYIPETPIEGTTVEATTIDDISAGQAAPATEVNGNFETVTDEILFKLEASQVNARLGISDRLLDAGVNFVDVYFKRNGFLPPAAVSKLGAQLILERRLANTILNLLVENRVEVTRKFRSTSNSPNDYILTGVKLDGTKQTPTDYATLQQCYRTIDR